MTSESSEAAALSTAAYRVGDAQRAKSAEVLTDAFVKGELSHAELDARTALCLAAVTHADLARLTSDLPGHTGLAPVSSAIGEFAKLGAVRLWAFIGFEVALMFVAYVLGVDLESELRAWHVIAFEIWAVGSLAGVAGAVILRPARRSAKR